MIYACFTDDLLLFILCIPSIIYNCKQIDFFGLKKLKFWYTNNMYIYIRIIYMYASWVYAREYFLISDY